MNSRVSKIMGLVMALVVALGVGAAIGGGIVYGATRVATGPLRVAAANDTDPESGIVILQVVAEGPADEAGVVRGDILLAIDREGVDDLPDLWSALEEREPGDEVKLTVLHGDEDRTLTATLGDRNGRPFLGLSSCRDPLDVPPPDHRILSPGALILEVMPESPAEQAGLQGGDHITVVDEQDVDAENDLADLITAHEVGDTVTLEVEAPGEEPREVTVELAEHPEEKGNAYLGIRYVGFPGIGRLNRHELPFRMPRLHFDFDKERFWSRPGSGARQGAIIRQVVEDSPAEAAGLRKGDAITAIDGESVESPRALADAVAEHKPGDTITLIVARGDETEEREVEVRLAEDPEEEGSAYLGVMIGGFFMLRLEDRELPPDIELPDGSFRFRLPFIREHLELDLDGVDDVLRRFEFHLPPQDLDLKRPSPPGESV